MPTYEYECESCGNRFEIFQSMNEEALTECEKCGKILRRLIFGGAGIIFKGSGFYSTDSKSACTSCAPAKTEKKQEATCCAKTEAGSCSSGNCAAAK